MRVLIVSQDGCVPMPVRAAILAKTNIQPRAEAADAARLLECVKTFVPQVVLLDAGIPDVLDLIAQLLSVLSRLRCILLTEERDSELELEALRRGAHGSLTANCSAEQLSWALDAVCRGELWASRRAVSSLLVQLLRQRAERPGQTDDSSAGAPLTRREQEVALWLSRGLTNKEIGRRLAISDLTVKSHLQHIYAKLGVHRRVQVGLTPPTDPR